MQRLRAEVHEDAAAGPEAEAAERKHCGRCAAGFAAQRAGGPEEAHEPVVAHDLANQGEELRLLLVWRIIVLSFFFSFNNDPEFSAQEEGQNKFPHHNTHLPGMYIC
jgi:hypothetical protein